MDGVRVRHAHRRGTHCAIHGGGDRECARFDRERHSALAAESFGNAGAPTRMHSPGATFDLPEQPRPVRSRTLNRKPGIILAAFRDLAALALIASAISACGGTRRAAPAPAASPAPAATPAPAANPTPEIIATGDAAAIERARADSAAHPWTEADAHFMTAMIG